MNPVKTIIAIVVALVATILLFSAAYTVQETEQVIITQFGKPVGGSITNAGLHFKTPFIQEVNRIEKRILEWDGQPNEMPTKDKTYILVDTFGRWQISDFKQFFLRLRDERSALSRLNDILGSETRNAIAKHELIEVIRTTKDRVPERDETLTDAPGNIGVLYPITAGRGVIEKDIFEKAAPKLKEFGIELMDVLRGRGRSGRHHRPQGERPPGDRIRSLQEGAGNSGRRRCGGERNLRQRLQPVARGRRILHFYQDHGGLPGHAG